MEIYTLDVYKTTESLVIKGFSAIQNLLRYNLGFQNCIKDGKNIDPAAGFRVIIVIEANSYVNIRSSRLLPKFKTQKINSWCAA